MTQVSEVGHLYALLIGINEYESPMLRRLQFAVADVLEVRDLLRERLGLDDEHHLLLPPADAALTGGPRRADVLDALDRFANAGMEEADTFLLYFAGHGFATEGETFLMAADSRPGSAALLRKTALPLRELEEFLHPLRAGQQVLILDACQNDPFAGSRGIAPAQCDPVVTRDITALVKPREVQAGAPPGRRSRAVLNACWQGSASYEFPAERHGWFCWHLLRNLRGFPGGTLELTPQWAEEVGLRMRESAALRLREAAGQEPCLLLEGLPIRLQLSSLKRAGTFVPATSDPAKVEVKEVTIAPLRIEVEQVVRNQVEAPGLPPIPGDILELEGRLEGLDQAIRLLENGTHPSLKPAQQAVRQMKEHWEALVRDLEANTPALASDSQKRLQTEALKMPLVSVSQLCTLAPGVPTAFLLPYVQRLRHAERARAALEQTQREYEAARQRELNRLREEAASAAQALRRRKEEDLSAVLEVFLDQVGATPEFPLEAWNAFEPSLLQRRYPWADRETVERAERQTESRRLEREKAEADRRAKEGAEKRRRRVEARRRREEETPRNPEALRVRLLREMDNRKLRRAYLAARTKKQVDTDSRSIAGWAETTGFTLKVHVSDVLGVLFLALVGAGSGAMVGSWLEKPGMVSSVALIGGCLGTCSGAIMLATTPGNVDKLGKELGPIRLEDCWLTMEEARKKYLGPNA